MAPRWSTRAATSRSTSTDAEANGLTITHVLETHFHADFVSGHLELAAVTGAEICYGEAAEPDFPVRHLAHGERLAARRRRRRVPGHAGPHAGVGLLPGLRARRTTSSPWAVLTGDTLFVGDVGRPDLLAVGRGHPGVDGPPAATGRCTPSCSTLPDATRGVSRSRRRLGVRPVAVERDMVDDRRAAPHQLRPAAARRGWLRRRHRRGSARCACVLQRRRASSTGGGIRCSTRTIRLPRWSGPELRQHLDGGAIVHRHPFAPGLRRRPPAVVDQRRPRRAVRRVRRRRDRPDRPGGAGDRRRGRARGQGQAGPGRLRPDRRPRGPAGGRR